MWIVFVNWYRKNNRKKYNKLTLGQSLKIRKYIFNFLIIIIIYIDSTEKLLYDVAN